MSAIIHFINLYAQSGGAVTASAAKAGQDAFVRDWMAAAKGERVLIPDPLGDRRTDEAV